MKTKTRSQKICKVVGETLEGLGICVMWMMTCVDISETASLKPLLIGLPVIVLIMILGYMIADTRHIGRIVYPLYAVTVRLIYSIFKLKHSVKLKQVAESSKQVGSVIDTYYYIQDRYDSVYGTDENQEEI